MNTPDLTNPLTGQTVQPTDTYLEIENFQTIQVLEEQLQVSTETVETGRVRLSKTIQVEEQVVDTPLFSEKVVVERVAADRYVDEVPATRQEGDTTIYLVVKEEVVVQKKLRVVEEIRVTRQRTQVADTQTVSLRREVVTVDRLPAGSDSERSDPSTGSSL